MDNQSKKLDYLGAYLMVAMVIVWSARLDLDEIIKHARAHIAALEAECGE